jgi:hypothetical protein
MTVSTIYKLLDKMEMMILKGTPIPVTPWVIVHHEKLIDLQDKIRASIPAEIQEAHGIIKRRDEIQLEAQNKSAQIISDAKREAHMLLSESELLKAVQAEAERIRNQVIEDCEKMRKQAQEETERARNMAITEAVQIRDGADRYAESVLDNLDKNLSDIHNIVRNGKSQLIRMKSEPAPGITGQNINYSIDDEAEFEVKSKRSFV